MATDPRNTGEIQVWKYRTLMPVETKDGPVPALGTYYEVIGIGPGENGQPVARGLGKYLAAECAAYAAGLPVETPPRSPWTRRVD